MAGKHDSGRRHKKFSVMVLLTVAGLTCPVLAQEVDADALIGTLNAEISKIDEREAKETPKAESAAKDETSLLKPQPKPQRKKVARPVLDESGERATKDSKVVVVMAFGKGETKEEARKNAFRSAIEKAVGVYVDAESMMQNYEMVKDRVNTISNADITKCETLKEGRLKSGGYGVQIRATVEKKAITPKFKDVFPAAFADVEGVASSIHAHKITAATRSADAASLMKAAIGDVDRMRNWVRLSVVKGKGLRPIAKFRNYRSPESDVAEVPGKGLYAVRYSMRIDEDAYFKGFVPHFKQVLEKMQEGESEEAVLSVGPLSTSSLTPDLNQTDDEHTIVMTPVGQITQGRLPADLRAFDPHMDARIGGTYFVDPVTLSEFPGLISGSHSIERNVRQDGGFMFDSSKGLAKVNEARLCNLWLLEKMNKSKTSVRCRAYKVPVTALRAYWKNLYGEMDSNYVYSKSDKQKMESLRFYQNVEIILLDENGEEITARIDHVPAMLLTNGYDNCDRDDVRTIWGRLNVFDSFFIRPMFVHNFVICGSDGVGYSTEVQRDVYFPLTDAQLAEVKKIRIRFVGGRKSKSSSNSNASEGVGTSAGRRQRRR